MDDFIYRQNYFDDPHARQAFQEFLRLIHGLDLARWEREGFWDDLYLFPFTTHA